MLGDYANMRRKLITVRIREAKNEVKRRDGEENKEAEEGDRNAGKH